MQHKPTDELAQPQRNGAQRMARRPGVLLYKISCMTSGKSYIGITILSARKRLTDHMYDALMRNSPTYLHRAIRKHGPEVFSIRNLSRYDSWEAACVAERMAIMKHRTRAPYGYNLTDGGEGSLGVVLSARSRALISKSRKGIKLLPHHRAAIVASNIRRPTVKQSKSMKLKWKNPVYRKRASLGNKRAWRSTARRSALSKRMVAYWRQWRINQHSLTEQAS